METTTAVIHGVGFALAEIASFFDRSFSALAEYDPGGAVDHAATGPAFDPLAGPTGGRPADLEVGFPTEAPVSPAGDGARQLGVPAGRVARVSTSAADGHRLIGDVERPGPLDRRTGPRGRAPTCGRST